jgi:hypothetical protein
MTTNLYALFNGLTIILALVGFYTFKLPAGVITLFEITSWITINHLVCYSHWNVSIDLSSPLHAIFSKMKKNRVTFIDVNSIDQFELTVIMDRETEQTDEKKAA